MTAPSSVDTVIVSPGCSPVLEGAPNHEPIYVPEGETSIRLVGERYSNDAGDYVGLSTGEVGTHQGHNTSEAVPVSRDFDRDRTRSGRVPRSKKIAATADIPPDRSATEDGVSEFYFRESTTDYRAGELEETE